MYLMSPVADRLEDFNEYAQLQAVSNVKLLSYEIYGYTVDPTDRNLASVDLYYKVEVGNGEAKQVVEKDNVKWDALKEHNIWKIKPKFDVPESNQ